MSTTTVRIDIDLKRRVEKLIANKFKRIKYESAKQFVNYAIIDLLEKEEEK